MVSASGDEQDRKRLRLVVGLGNPGAKYEKTRHNIGFDCLNLLSKKWSGPIPMTKYEGQLSKVTIQGVEVLLLWPMTFMNASGRCVQQVVRFYKIDPSDVLVVCDDLALPIGKLRVRRSGSAGGQKGLADILRVLGTQDVPRLRIGIDPCPPQWETADYVLSRFRSEERETVELALERAAEAISCWVDRGIDHCMNIYNRGDVL